MACIPSGISSVIEDLPRVIRVVAARPDPRRNKCHSIADAAASALAPFLLPVFQRRMEDQEQRSSCQPLSSSDRMPADSTIRSLLDDASSAVFDDLFPHCLDSLVWSVTIARFLQPGLARIATGMHSE